MKWLPPNTPVPECRRCRNPAWTGTSDGRTLYSDYCSNCMWRDALGCAALILTGMVCGVMGALLCR